MTRVEWDALKPGDLIVSVEGITGIVILLEYREGDHPRSSCVWKGRRLAGRHLGSGGSAAFFRNWSTDKEKIDEALFDAH